ncbi:MAG: ribosome recycling factor [Polyangiales bacterium]
MIEEILAELEQAGHKAHENLRRELARLRTGRANADLLDSIRVDYYGSPTPLRQLANISVPEARTLAVRPFDRSQVRAVERAISESDLGLNPQSDGEVLRIPMPVLTEERRKDLVKLAKRQGEDAKIAVRKARHEAKDLLDRLEKDGDASADDVERAKKKLEEAVSAAVTQVDTIVASKEKDILAV